MPEVKCINKCLKGGLLRRVGDTMVVGSGKDADALVKTGNWELVGTAREEPAPKKPAAPKGPAKPAASKDPLA